MHGEHKNRTINVRPDPELREQINDEVIDSGSRDRHSWMLTAFREKIRRDRLNRKRRQS